MNPSPSSSLSDSRIDFVLVTALPEERDAVLDKLPGYLQLSPAKDDIRTYFQVDLPVTFPDNSAGSYRVIAICLLGMGRVQAVTATADAIRRWHPRYIVLVGIAGGITARNIQIGDILISDQVVDYELQKLTPDGPEVRWEVQRADARLLNACNNFRNEGWQELIKIKRPGRGKPIRHIGPIASGDKVIAFSEVLSKYRGVWPKLIGVEMEAAGVSAAAFQSSDRPGFFMVRGVSDLADENKGSIDVAKWRAYACDVAASFTVAFLRRGPVPLSEEINQVKTIKNPEGNQQLKKEAHMPRKGKANNPKRKVKITGFENVDADIVIGSRIKASPGTTVPSEMSVDSDTEISQIKGRKFTYTGGDVIDYIQPDLKSIEDILATAFETKKEKQVEARQVFVELEKEVNQPKPDTDHIRDLLEKLLKLAQIAQIAGPIVEQIRPHLQAIASQFGISL